MFLSSTLKRGTNNDQATRQTQTIRYTARVTLTILGAVSLNLRLGGASHSFLCNCRAHGGMRLAYPPLRAG